MYLHLGQESIVRTRDILGIFDLDTASLSRHKMCIRDRACPGGKMWAMISVRRRA